MSSRRPLILVGLVPLLALVALWTWRPELRLPSLDMESASVRQDVLAFDYRAVHAGQSLFSAPAEEAAIAGKLKIQGTLRLVHSQEAGEPIVALSFVRLDEIQLSLLGSEIDDADKAEEVLLGSWAFAALNHDGAVERVSFSQDAPPLFRHLAESLLLETQVVAQREARSWQARERSPRGVLIAAYERQDPDGTKIHKAWDNYESVAALPTRDDVTVLVEGLASIQLRDGRVVDLTAEETLLAEDREGEELLTTRMTLALHEATETGSARAPRIPKKGWHPAGQPVSPAELQRQAALAQADGMTTEQLVADLTRHAGGIMPEHNRWLYRATGVLRAQPEACDELADLFLGAPLSPRGRALVLDLLVSAGTEPAQDALLRALSSEAVKEAPDYRDWLQRLATLEHPTTAVIQFVADEYVRIPRLRHATAATLGSVAGAAITSGDPLQEGLAHALIDRIGNDLQSADEPKERRAYLRALGNAACRAALTILSAYARSSDTLDRIGVADALGGYQDEVSEELLLELAGDSAPSVQAAALAALSRFRMTEPLLAGLLEIALADRIDENNGHLVLNLIATHAPQSEMARQVAAAMLANGPPHSNVGARLRSLLAGF